jgi:hypothetical protein
MQNPDENNSKRADLPVPVAEGYGDHEALEAVEDNVDVLVDRGPQTVTYKLMVHKLITFKFMAHKLMTHKLMTHE